MDNRLSDNLIYNPRSFQTPAVCSAKIKETLFSIKHVISVRYTLKYKPATIKILVLYIRQRNLSGA